ncbi:MAG: FAD-dependent oxidoreductase [Bacteroidota bacterium]
MHYEILIIGGGVFGITSAIALAKRQYKVGLLNPDQIPHPTAASNDISKIVRMEYGSDELYFEMARQSIEGWRKWNELFQEELYHEIGFLMLGQQSFESDEQQFERASLRQLKANGFASKKLNCADLQKYFPAINSTIYKEGCFNPVGGYVESGRTIKRLADYAKTLGVRIHEGQTAKDLVIERKQLKAVKTREGNIFPCDHAIVAAGAHSPYLLPELQLTMKVTGHPIFWLKPKNPDLFSTPNLPVFTADIANTGWYGFPYHPKQGIVKIANHSAGQILHPEKDERIVSEAAIEKMRTFLSTAFPSLADASIVYTRICLYTDTLDGHFWIDHHPKIKGLSVSTGGSGHAMKMAPVLGGLIADVVERKSNVWKQQFQWRRLSEHTLQKEEARNLA